MKNLIEVFQWQHEGEFTQCFFIAEDENVFVQEMLTHLNTVAVKDEFPWSDPLMHFKEEQQVAPFFLNNAEHINDTYFLEFEYSSGFSLSKRTTEYKHEAVKYD